ncbi:MAG: hydantoinase B/oxoprolinase family protein [Candidatus Binatia bacterium]
MATSAADARSDVKPPGHRAVRIAGPGPPRSATSSWRATRTSAAHIGDYTIIKPVFCNNKPVLFPSVRAHMLDVGGPAVGGGISIDAREVWQELLPLPADQSV